LVSSAPCTINTDPPQTAEQLDRVVNQLAHVHEPLYMVEGEVQQEAWSGPVRRLLWSDSTARPLTTHWRLSSAGHVAGAVDAAVATVLRHYDDVLDPHTEAPRQVDAGVNRKMARLESSFKAVMDRMPFWRAYSSHAAFKAATPVAGIHTGAARTASSPTEAESSSPARAGRCPRC
jgi:hypothetical protein